jgi:hypothetical protein
MADNDLVRDPPRDPELEATAREEMRRRGMLSRPNVPAAAPAPGEAPPLPNVETRSGTIAPILGAASAPPTKPPFNEEEFLRGRAGTLEKQLFERPPATTTKGKILRTLGTVGQDIGTAIAPGVMRSIPGSDAYRRAALHNVLTMLGEEESRKSEGILKGAQAKNLLSEAAARGGWKMLEDRQTDPNDPSKVWAAFEKPGEIDPATGAPRTAWFPLGPTEQPTRGAEAGMPSIPGTQPQAPAAPGTIKPVTPTPPTPSAAAPPPMAAPTPAAPPARGQLPPGTVYGKPTKPDETEKAIDLYLQQHKLPNTFENRERARDLYKHGGPMGADATAMNETIKDALRDTPLDSKNYFVNEDTPRDFARDKFMQAQHEANNYRMNQAPYVREDIKDKQTPVYAEDKNGVLIKTNRYAAQQQNFIFSEITPADIEKDRTAITQLNDIQLKTSRYRNSTNALPGAISTIHAQDMATILNDEKIQAGMLFGVVPGANYIADILKTTDKARMWNALTDKEQNVLNDYIAARTAAMMYQRAIGAITRLPESMIHLEINNLPEPYVGASVANKRFDAWQENINLASRRFPHNLPGAPHPSEVKKEVEAQGAAAAAATAAPQGGHNFSYNGRNFKNVPDEVYKKYKGKPGFAEK